LLHLSQLVKTGTRQSNGPRQPAADRMLPIAFCRLPIAGQPVFGGQQENQRAAAKKYAPIGVKSQALCEKLQAK